MKPKTPKRLIKRPFFLSILSVDIQKITEKDEKKKFDKSFYI